MTDAMTDYVHRTVPILGAMGIEVLESAPGRAVALLPLEANGNHVGMAYAGSLFSVAEMLGGVLAFSSFPLEGYAPIVRSMSIDFRRPALTDVRATAEMSAEECARVVAEATATGKSNYELTVDVVDEGGVTVARTVAQYQLRDFSGRE